MMSQAVFFSFSQASPTTTDGLRQLWHSILQGGVQGGMAKGIVARMASMLQLPKEARAEGLSSVTSCKVAPACRTTPVPSSNVA